MFTLVSPQVDDTLDHTYKRRRENIVPQFPAADTMADLINLHVSNLIFVLQTVVAVKCEVSAAEALLSLHEL